MVCLWNGGVVWRRQRCSSQGPLTKAYPQWYVEEAERSDGTPMAARAPGGSAGRPLVAGGQELVATGRRTAYSFDSSVEGAGTIDVATGTSISLLRNQTPTGRSAGR